jgi:hypothetical protein
VILNDGPQPGDVYKEWTYQHIGHADAAFSPHFAEVDPQGKHQVALELSVNHKPETPRYLVIDDLEHAIRAELAIEYWGGHIGTSFRGFRVNGHEWLPIPRPLNTPTEPERFYHTLLGSLATPIPLEQLHSGVNEFSFGAGPQIAYGFDCGFFWVYSFTIRIYYAPSKPHPTARILSPTSGEVIGDFPVIEAVVDTGNAAQVDFLAHYKDFNWEGDGRNHQWHAQRSYGVLRHHVMNRAFAPYRVTWNTTWVPDQDEPIRLAAQITAPDRVKFMTASIDGILLSRPDRAVIMIEPQGVPENFSVRIGQQKTCDLFINGELSQAQRARLVLSTWSGAHADALGLNDSQLAARVGRVHDYSFDILDVPLNALRQERNTFFIFSSTYEHAAEVNWPGPALFVEYSGHPRKV